ncbi:Laccase-14 [Sesamum alatum]|uniref:Laccase n=1 Tax=Sesamum alatum TaxID=300844 RepID=A0AAE2CN87_9LAMI|nr:Laccase-14 [Sesamum alatum]
MANFQGQLSKFTEGRLYSSTFFNRGKYNITIHWHGVRQPRNPWTDGPEYITQCPIQPGSSFSQKVIFSKEEGTLWWHAHSGWFRTTVHGAIIIYPKPGAPYPFAKPDAEVPIILGEWWKEDIVKVRQDYLESGGQPRDSDAYTINGQPGDLYPCSKNNTFQMTVDHGKTYLVRMVNAAMNAILFVRIANHNITVVGTDGAYTKPLKSDYITISPGQTIDFLFEANQPPSHYYMAASAYASAGPYDNTTTTAILQYSGNYTRPSSPLLPSLPEFNDTLASTTFTTQLRSLSNKDYPIEVPLNVTNKFFFTISLNLSPCVNNSCAGPFNERFLASLNNVSFDFPRIDVLQAYYEGIKGVYGTDFPSNPSLKFNYTASIVPRDLWVPVNGTKVKVLEYNSTVELVFQGTNIVAGIDHPMHLHGYSFYVVGSGFGNFDRDRDPLNYNLVDPPLQNTITVPRNGWTAIRFKASNPGVWLLHCHLARHYSWGMLMAFIVKDGNTPDAKMLPPPPYMPPC